MNITIPNDVKYIIDTFYKNGYTAFMVGGCIRDALLNKTPMDYDIATSAPPDVTEKLFSKTIPTGIQHGTITVLINGNPYEVTTYRTEGKYINNRKPDSVSFISHIKGDLSRRDFTINAFAYNDREGLIDYFSGNNDLNNGIIRCVGIANTRFTEDALRILRAIRFSAQLNFEIESSTYYAILKNADLIRNISNERIRAEFSKTLLCDNPFRGLSLLNSSGILSIIFPFNVVINESINNLPKDLSCRLASLFLGLDSSIVVKELKKLTYDNATIDKTKSLIDSFKSINKNLSKAEIKRLINEVGKNNIDDLLKLYEVLNNDDLSNIKVTIDAIYNNNEPLTLKDLAIKGSDLKSITSGKNIGYTLNHLLNLVIDESLVNDKDILLKEANNFIKIHSI